MGRSRRIGGDTYSLSLCYGLNVDKLSASLAFGEHYCTIDQSIQGMILADTYVEAGMMYGATLALEDVAGFSMLTTKNLNTESFAF